MAEALSRSEVESLLSALNPGQAPANRSAFEQPAGFPQQATSSELARRVVSLFEQFRQAMTAATGQMLPGAARLKRHMPLRMPFSELRHRAGDDSLCWLVESEQSGGDLLVILDRQLAVQLVCGMLGQGATAEEPSQMPLSEALSPIEQRLLLRWLRESLAGVVDASLWQPLEIELVHSDRVLDAYRAQAPWWCEVWELKAEHLRGRIELCGSWEFFSALPPETSDREIDIAPVPLVTDKTADREQPGEVRGDQPSTG